MATLMLCRVGVQPPAVAEEGTCMGECYTCQGGHSRLGLVLHHETDISVDSPQLI